MRPEEKLFDAVTGIDEGLVESTQTYVFRKKTRTWQRIASLAACLLVVASIGFGILQMASIGGSNSAANSSGAASESGSDAGTAGGSSGDAGAAAGDTADGGAPALTTFTATVLEVSEGYLLVEPVEGDAMLATADRILVSVSGLTLPDGVAEGAVVAITFDGFVRESYPAQISGVTEIVLVGD